MKKKTILISSLALSLVLSLGAVALTNNTSGLDLGAAEEGPIIWKLSESTQGTDKEGFSFYYSKYHHPLYLTVINNSNSFYMVNTAAIGRIKSITLDMTNTNYNADYFHNTFDVNYGYDTADWYVNKELPNTEWTFDSKTGEATLDFSKLDLLDYPNYFQIGDYNASHNPYAIDDIVIRYGSVDKNGAYECTPAADPYK